MRMKPHDIKDYIPQREPFIMVDQLLQLTATGGLTRFRADKENLFSQQGYFTEPGLIENMAQSIAAVKGAYFAQKQAPAPIGFIGGIKNLKIHALPPVDRDFQTEIHILHSFVQIEVAAVRCFFEDIEYASAEFKIYIKA